MLIRNTKKAFTLLELIVVIVILGVLALIAIPTYSAVIAKSKDSTLQRTAGAVGRNAVALAAFDQKNVSDLTVDTTDNPAWTYTDLALSEASGNFLLENGTASGYTLVADANKNGTIDTGERMVTVTITGSVVKAGAAANHL